MKSKMKNWEYLVVNNINDEKLNEFGVNGWELISIVYFPPMSCLPLVKFYFKKQLV